MRRRRLWLLTLLALTLGPTLVPVADEGLLGRRLVGSLETWRQQPGSQEVAVRGGLQTLCKRGFIYLLSLRLAPGTGSDGRSEFFKIGGTQDMERRLPAYVTAQPFNPEVVSAVPVPDWRASEKKLLAAFPRSQDLDGGEEWRRLTEDELERALGLMEAEVGEWADLAEEAVPLSLARAALAQSNMAPAGSSSMESLQYPELQGLKVAKLQDIHRLAARAAVEHFSQQQRSRAVVVMPEGTEIAAVGVEIAKMMQSLGVGLQRVLVVVEGWTDLEASCALWLEAQRSGQLNVQGVAAISRDDTIADQLRQHGLPIIKPGCKSAGSRSLGSFLNVAAGHCHVVVCKKDDVRHVRSAMDDLDSSKRAVDLMVIEDALKTTARLKNGAVNRDAVDDNLLLAKNRVFLTSCTCRILNDHIDVARCAIVSMNQTLCGPMVFRLARSAAVQLGLLRPIKILQYDMEANCSSKTSKSLQRASAILDCMQTYSLNSVYAFVPTQAASAHLVKELEKVCAPRERPLKGFRVEGCLDGSWRTLDNVRARFRYTESFLSGDPSVVSSVFVILDNRTAPPADMAFVALNEKCSHLRMSQVLRLVGRHTPGKEHGILVVPRENTLTANRTAMLVVGTLVAQDPGLVASLRRFLLQCAALGHRLPVPEWPQELRELFVEGSELSLEQMGQAFTVASSGMDSLWEFRADLLRAFRLREGHAKVPENHVEVGVALGSWLAEQQSAAQTGELTLPHLQRLEDLGVDFVGAAKSKALQKDKEWQRFYGQLLAFVAREGDSDVEALVKWMRKQRANNKSGQLTKEQRSLLESLGVDLSYDERSLDQRWKDNLKALRTFKKREGHVDVPLKHTEGEAKLGAWISSQRSKHKAGKLPAARAKKLEALGVNLAPRKAQWDTYADALSSFAQREGHADVPGDHVESGLALGQWLDCQRGLATHGGLNQKQVRRLKALGVEMDSDEARWTRTFQALSRFAKASGNALPSRTEDEQSERQLGLWLYAQKKKARAGKLSRERLELLQEIGVEFEA